MHGHTCQYYMGKQGISVVPTYTKSIPQSSLLDDHSTCFIRKYGEAMETVHQTNSKNMSTIALSTIETVPTQLLSGPEAEFNILNNILTSYQPLIEAATWLLKKEPSFDGIPVSSKHMRRSLLCLGDVLSWLTGTATTKEVKTRNNQLITTQQSQQETLVHVISMLNITRYATQVNRQHITILMDTMEKMHQDITTLYNITHSLYSSLTYQQIILHIWSSLAQPLGFTTLYVRSHHTHHGLYWCSNHRNTLTTCTTCWRSEGDTETHWGNTSFHHAPVNFIWRHYISTDIYVPTS